jgi:hypothetical protein
MPEASNPRRRSVAPWRVPATLRRSALGLLAALAVIPSVAGCFGAPAPEKEAPPEITNSPAVVARAVYDTPGRLALRFEQGDYRSGDLVVPPGKYQIESTNVDSDVDIGFLLSLPDQYGRETNHLAAGGGIRKGKSRVFEVELLPRQTYLYSCPVSDSPKHLIRTVEGPPAPLPPAPTPAPVEGAPSDSPDPLDAEPAIDPAVDPAIAPAGASDDDLYLDESDPMDDDLLDEPASEIDAP